MKYKVGERIKIIDATSGCYGANEKIGTVTNKPSTDGLCDDQDGFNVDCGKGHIWRIGFASECELLDELTAEEAIRILGGMCKDFSCCECPIYELIEDEGSCDIFRAEKPDKVIEVLKQWKKEHEKKEVETEIVDLIKVMREVCDDETCIYTYEIDVNKEDINDKMRELVKEYSDEQNSKICAKYERICRVKS